MKLKLLLFCVLSLSGCSVFLPPPTFTNLQNNEIEEAKQLWKKALRPEVSKVRWPEFVPIYFNQISPHNALGRVLAFTADLHTVYVVTDRINNPAYQPKLVILHELAHAFGANHSKYGLMQPVYSTDYLCIDSDTLDQVAAANNLRREFLTPVCF
jgi:hypothetical protein